MIKQVSVEEAYKVNKIITEFNPPYSKQHFDETLKDKKKLIIVFYNNTKGVGYLIGYDKYNDGSFYCWMTGVDPEYRKQGVLKAMMEYLNKWVKKENYTKIKIKTRNSRREMLSYLVKYGFLFTNVLEKPNILDNNIYLEKDL